MAFNLKIVAKRFILSRKDPNVPGFLGLPLYKFAFYNHPGLRFENQLYTHAYSSEKVSGRTERTIVL